MSDEDPRARLAYDRTLLANERTFAAWLRTGLSIAAIGLAVAHLVEAPSSRTLQLLLAGLFVLLGVLVTALGAWRFVRVNRDLAAAGSPATAVAPMIVLALTLLIALLLLGLLFV